jgi:mannose-P-dolichol utilization defect protein 1
MIKALVNVAAEWAWGIESGENGISAEFCLENFFPFPPIPCIVALAMKGLGIAIIAGACLNKAPLILNIVNNKSVAGMSTSAIYGEIIMYANSAFYSVLKGNPFTTYGENLIVTFQTMIVCVLCWVYAVPKISISQRLMAIAVFAVYLFGVFGVLTPDYYYMLMSVNFPVLIFSRGSQIYTFYQCKHTGTQSLITTGMNLLGSAIRVLTTISEIGFDIPMLSGYAISLVLNTILVFQFIMYKKKTGEYLDSLKKKSE